jgi:hypothetical protein
MKFGDEVVFKIPFLTKLLATVGYWNKTNKWRWPPKTGIYIGFNDSYAAYEFKVATESYIGTWLVTAEKLKIFITRHS